MSRFRRTPDESAPMSAKNIARYGLLTAVMLVLGFIERQFPIVAAIPGIRLGLANVALLYAIYLLGSRSAWSLLAVKVALGGLLYAGVTGAMYSLAGGAFAVGAMLLARRIRGLGVSGVSVCGAVAHIVGQILLSRLLLGSWAAALQAPLLVASAAVTGVLTGISAEAVMRALKKGNKSV